MANDRLPSLTAQYVGREIYHGRQDIVRVIGDQHTLEKIAWIFRRVPDMFEVVCGSSSLLVRRPVTQAIDKSDFDQVYDDAARPRPGDQSHQLSCTWPIGRLFWRN